MNRSEGPRYSPADFEDFVLEEAQTHVNGDAPPVVIGPLTLQADACPAIEAFVDLMDSSQKFRATFERRRRDMQDVSASAYDMALASAAIRAGWSDQETANLIIFGRRKYLGDVEKALRLDYMTMTLRKVRQGVEQDQAVSAIEDLYSKEPAEGEPRQKKDPEELRTLVSRALEIQVSHVKKYGVEEPEYELVTSEGSAKLGKVEGLIVHPRVRNAIAASCGIYIRDFTNARWRAIAQALLHLAEQEEVGEETTDSGILRGWLDDYVAPRTLGEVCESSLLAREPVEIDGRPHIFLSSLQTWLFNKRGERVSVKWLAREMRRLGSLPHVENCELGGKRTTRELWPVP